MNAWLRVAHAPGELSKELRRDSRQESGAHKRWPEIAFHEEWSRSATHSMRLVGAPNSTFHRVEFRGVLLRDKVFLTPQLARLKLPERRSGIDRSPGNKRGNKLGDGWALIDQTKILGPDSRVDRAAQLEVQRVRHKNMERAAVGTGHNFAL
jgi:hypothetical protein